jgi:hypothetical protein
MSLNGISCPYGSECKSFKTLDEVDGDDTKIYYITTTDLDTIVDYGTNHPKLQQYLDEHECTALTHEEVEGFRVSIENLICGGKSAKSKEISDNEQSIIDSIKEGYHFAISTFTSAEKEFFRPESNVLLKLEGTLCAAFQSDAKTFATDKGNRAANLFRFSFPENENNLCRDWEQCKADKTHLWNEIIMKPSKVLDYKIVTKY